MGRAFRVPNEHRGTGGARPSDRYRTPAERQERTHAPFWGVWGHSGATGVIPSSGHSGTYPCARCMAALPCHHVRSLPPDPPPPPGQRLRDPLEWRQGQARARRRSRFRAARTYRAPSASPSGRNCTPASPVWRTASMPGAGENPRKPHVCGCRWSSVRRAARLATGERRRRRETPV